VWQIIAYLLRLENRLQQQSFHDLLFVLAAAVVLVFTVLLIEFGGFAAPVAILSIAVIGGIVASMVLSLLVTPAVHYYLTRE
jgi:multidrug efflux pump subunit AcrB